MIRVKDSEGKFPMVAVKSKKIGPKSDGMPISEWEFDAAEFVSGFKYELIDGRIDVSYEPEPQENGLEDWIYDHMKGYSAGHRDVIDRVVRKARVYIPGQRRTTVPEPDVACYVNFPHRRMLRDLSWHEVSPILTVEVLVYGNPEKDLVRNARLYLQVPSIREYWVIDGRISAEQPQLIQHRRLGTRWVIRTYSYAAKFTTKLLPGFELTVDPFA